METESPSLSADTARRHLRRLRRCRGSEGTPESPAGSIEDETSVEVTFSVGEWAFADEGADEVAVLASSPHSRHGAQARSRCAQSSTCFVEATLSWSKASFSRRTR